MNIKTIIISLLLFTSFVTGTILFAQSYASSMGVIISDDGINAFNQSLTLQTQINEDYKTIQNLSANSGSTYQIITLVPDALTIVKNMVVLPFAVLYDVIYGANTYLNLPGWFIILVTTIAGLVLLIAILSIILRFNV